MYGLPSTGPITLPKPVPSIESLLAAMSSVPSKFDSVVRQVRAAYGVYLTADPCGPIPYVSPLHREMKLAVKYAYHKANRHRFSRKQRDEAKAIYRITRDYMAGWETARRAAGCEPSSSISAPLTPMGCAPGFEMTCSPVPTSIVRDYGFIGTSWLAYNKMVPQDPQLTLEEDPPRLCLDMASEEKLQNQRKFSMYIGGPAVFIAGSKLKGPFGLFIMGLGVACTVWHATAHKKVKEIIGA